MRKFLLMFALCSSGLITSNAMAFSLEVKNDKVDIPNLVRKAWVRVYRVRRPLSLLRKLPNMEKIRLQETPWQMELNLINHRRRTWKRSKKARSIPRKLLRTKNFRWVTSFQINNAKTINVSKYGPGVYLVEYEQKQTSMFNKVSMAYTLAVATKLRIFAKRDAGSLLSYVVWKKNGVPVRRASVKVLRPKGRIQKQGQTNSKGIWYTRLAKSKKPSLLWAQYGPHVAFHSLKEAPDKQPIVRKSYLYTDRPLYRPGEQVNWKGVFREWHPKKGWRVLSNIRLQVTVKTSHQKVLFEKKLQTNSHGSSYSSFSLLKDAPVGTYTLRVTSRHKRSTWSWEKTFQVSEQRRPPFALSVRAVQKRIQPGQPLQFKIQATSFSGGPIASGRVRWKLFRMLRKHQPEPQTHRSGQHKERWGKETLYRLGKDRLNKSGMMKLHIQTVKGAYEARYRLHVELSKYTSIRVFQTAQAHAVTPRWDLQIRPSRYFVQGNEPIRLHIHATHTTGKQGVRLPIQFTVDGEKRSYSTTTNRKGIATLTLRTQRVGKLVVRARIAKTKREVATEVWKLTRNKSITLPKKLELLTERTSYKVGDNIRMMVASTQPNGWWLVTWVTHGIVRHRVVYAKKSVFFYNFVAKEVDAPNIEVSFSCWSQGKWLTIKKNIPIKPSHRKLKIAVSSDRKQYKPGSHGRFTIKVMDSKGRPVRGVELSVALVDESVYAIKKDNTPNPLSVFLAHRAPMIHLYHKLKMVFSGEFLSQWRFWTLFPKPGKLFFADFYFSLKRYRRALRYGNTQEAWRFYRLLNRYAEHLSIFRNESGAGGVGMYGGGRGGGGMTLRGYGRRIRVRAGRATVYGGSRAPRKIRMRKDFRRSLLWKPALQTSKDGTVTLQVKYPDQLTQWRLTVVAVSRKTHAAIHRYSTQTQMPFYLSLTTPTSLTESDIITLAATLHNQTSRKLQSKLRFKLKGLHWIHPAPKTVELGPHSHKQILLTVQAKRGKRKAVLSVAAHSGQLQDGLIRSVPIRPQGIPIAQWRNGLLQPNRPWTTKWLIPPDTKPQRMALHLRMDAKPTDAFQRPLHYLIRYPHGCAEQTTSRFLPLLAAYRSWKLHKLPTNDPMFRKLKTYTKAGIKRLAAMQNTHGFWSWWPSHGATSMQARVGLSAYVMAGFAFAKEAGFTIPQQTWERGEQALLRFVKSNTSNPIDRAYAILALSRTHLVYLPTNTLLKKAMTLKHAPFLWALLAIALHRQKRTSQALPLLKKLAQQASPTNKGLVHWRAHTGVPRHWHNDPIETTAVVIQAFALLQPKHPLLSKAVSWLLLRRRRGLWRSTRDTAAALQALSLVLKPLKSQEQNSHLLLQLNGHSIKVPVAKASRSGWVYRGSFLRSDNNTLSVQWKAPGQSRINTLLQPTIQATLEYTTSHHLTKPRPGAFAVSRRYFRMQWKQASLRPTLVPTHLGSTGLRPGDLVLVQLKIRNKRKSQFVQIEDSIPSGFQVIRNYQHYPIDNRQDLFNYKQYKGHREIYRDRIIYFFSEQQTGKTLHLYHLLLAAHPGRVTALPARASLLYFPLQQGLGASKKLTIFP